LRQLNNQIDFVVTYVEFHNLKNNTTRCRLAEI